MIILVSFCLKSFPPESLLGVNSSFRKHGLLDFRTMYIHEIIQNGKKKTERVIDYLLFILGRNTPNVELNKYISLSKKQQ